MSYTKDWTTWAGDNPEQAEAELRAERQINEQWHDFTEEADCPHEFNLGVCLICEAEDEDYEPSDAQIFAHYGQTKTYEVSA